MSLELSVPLAKGVLLIAKPSSVGDFFSRTVVLITEYGPGGAVGFVLNKPLNKPVSKFVPDLKSDLLVNKGGPVQTENIYYLHSRPDLITDSLPIADGLFWSGSYQDLKHNLNNGILEQKDLRFFIGYSGWANNQLEAEIENKAWEVLPTKGLDVFKDWDTDLWKKQLIKIGGEHLLFVNSPADPEMN